MERYRAGGFVDGQVLHGADTAHRQPGGNASESACQTFAQDGKPRVEGVAEIGH